MWLWLEAISPPSERCDADPRSLTHAGSPATGGGYPPRRRQLLPDLSPSASLRRPRRICKGRLDGTAFGYCTSGSTARRSEFEVSLPLGISPLRASTARRSTSCLSERQITLRRD